MKTIYLDSNFMCHLSNVGGYTEIQTDIFDEIVDSAIPFFRYIPDGKTWENDKGIVLYGLFVQSTNSDAIDREIQTAMINDMRDALALLGVTE